MNYIFFYFRRSGHWHCLASKGLWNKKGVTWHWCDDRPPPAHICRISLKKCTLTCTCYRLRLPSEYLTDTVIVHRVTVATRKQAQLRFVYILGKKYQTTIKWWIGRYSLFNVLRGSRNIKRRVVMLKGGKWSRILAWS